MSNANFQVGFELKALKVGERVTFSINYFFIFELATKFVPLA